MQKYEKKKGEEAKKYTLELKQVINPETKISVIFSV